jgi:hypothetical protein
MKGSLIEDRVQIEQRPGLCFHRFGRIGVAVLDVTQAECEPVGGRRVSRRRAAVRTLTGSS